MSYISRPEESFFPPFLTPFYPPTPAHLLEERLACATSEYLPRQMHSKQCCSQCGCLAQLAAVLRPCFAGLSCVTCSNSCAEKDFSMKMMDLGLGWTKKRKSRDPLVINYSQRKQSVSVSSYPFVESRHILMRAAHSHAHATWRTWK